MRGRKTKPKNDEPQYCVCRTSDITRFMIACDKCEEWYHGECIHITPKQAETIKRFFCEKCRRKDSSLEIEYKGKTKGLKKDKKEKKKKRKHRELENEAIPISKKSRFGGNTKNSMRKERDILSHHLLEREYPPPAGLQDSDNVSANKRGLSMLPSDDMDDQDEIMLPHDDILHDDSATDDELETHGLPPAFAEEDRNRHARSAGNRSQGERDIDVSSDPSSAADVNHRCGQCSACRRSDDCGKCDFCKDMRKFGGSNRVRQRCRLRQCVNLVLSNSRSQDRHSNFYECGNKEFDFGNGDRRDSAAYDEMDSYEDAYAPEGHRPIGAHRNAQKLRRTELMSDGDSSNYIMLPGGDRRGGNTGYSSGGNGINRQRTVASPHRSQHGHFSNMRRHPALHDRVQSQGGGYSDSDEDSEGKLSDYRQCLGPKCILAARPSSSYCSDECAVKMATNRLLEILPARLAAWQASPCQAEERNLVQLQGVRAAQERAQQHLAKLDSEHRILDSLKQKAAQLTMQSEDAEDEEEEKSLQQTVFCVTCGNEVGVRSALRHMEKCFCKVEGQTSFGSAYKSVLQDPPLFCDAFNVSTKSYCKKLKMVCPEHYKDPKESADAICGCPIPSSNCAASLLGNDSGPLCRVARRVCQRHLNWERLRRAQIDVQRVRLLMKLEELVFEEREIRSALTNRAGVLGLLLHQTVEHSQHVNSQAKEQITSK